MRYICEIDIHLPIDKTVELWKNPDYFKNWQDGFERMEHISGQPETKGAKSKIYFNGKRKMELLETIITSDLPNAKIALYEHIHMTNTQASRFEAIGPNKTKYISEVEYTNFNGLLIKLMARLFPGKFKQQSQKWMEQFKAFAESTNN